MRDRLIELLWCIGRDYDEYCEDVHEVGLSPMESFEEMVADHLLANGIIVPPCKVGDTLYVLSQMRDKRILPFVSEYEATSITIGKRKCIVYHEMDGFIKSFKQDDFGKTVFLTREQAEKALKERSEG